MKLMLANTYSLEGSEPVVLEMITEMRFSLFEWDSINLQSILSGLLLGNHSKPEIQHFYLLNRGCD